MQRFVQGAKPVPEGLKIRTLFQIPWHRFALVRWLNRFLIIQTLRRLMRREKISQPILWFMIPHLGMVIGKLEEKLSVYYCIDDYPALPDVNPQAVQKMDEETTRKANLVFVASETLLEAKRRLNPNSHSSPHGVDFQHFAQVQSDHLPIPEDVAKLTGPVIGFFGLIERWIALDLIDYLAEQRPQWHFLMIGRIAVPEETVPRRPNIHFLGKLPYERLPAYGKRFDVAIIPYHLTRQVIHANPIKLREYLAMGKPIVSVSTPEIDKYADVVAIAHTKKEYLTKVDQALARTSTSEDIQRRMSRVASESWDARMGEVLQKVHQNLCALAPKT
jgi:glycosyltransferase involved in cell wall biosynthesis